MRALVFLLLVSIPATVAIASGTTTWQVSLPTLPDDDYTAAVSAVDRAGNRGPVFPVGVSFRIDATAPTAAFSGPPDGSSFARGATPALSGFTLDRSPTSTAIALARVGSGWPRWWDWRRRAWTPSPFAAGVWRPVGATAQWSVIAPPLPVDAFVAPAWAVDAAGNAALATTGFAVAPNAAQ